MKIAAAGTGYVGLSMAVLLSQHNTAKAVDILQEKVDKINAGKSPVIDKEIQEYLSTKKLDQEATTDGDGAYRDAEFVIISTPTSFRFFRGVLVLLVAPENIPDLIECRS